jgi:hypothetical protein
LRNGLLALAWLEKGYPFSTAELLAPVRVQRLRPVSSYELLAPLEEGIESPPLRGHFGIRSHSLLAILLGIADHGGSRRELLRAIREDMQGRGIFAQSREDLTPIRMDPPSLIPLGVVTGQLLLRPSAAHHISAGTVNTYSLTTAAVETIIGLDGK